MCDFLLMDSRHRGHIAYRLRAILVYYIIRYKGWKSSFSPAVLSLSIHCGGTPSNIKVIYGSLKVHSLGYIILSPTMRLYHIILSFVVVSQICEITRNSEKIRTYSSSRSSK